MYGCISNLQASRPPFSSLMMTSPKRNVKSYLTNKFRQCIKRRADHKIKTYEGDAASDLENHDSNTWHCTSEKRRLRLTVSGWIKVRIATTCSTIHYKLLQTSIVLMQHKNHKVYQYNCGQIGESRLNAMRGGWERRE
jgi:hypothetical protein